MKLSKRRWEKPEQKRLQSERGWAKQGVHYFIQREYQVVLELSTLFSVKRLCKIMDINRSGFYKWKYRLSHPSTKSLARAKNIELFKKYHDLYPSHGYRWLNAMIKNDLGVILSNVTAHRCCKSVGS